MPLEPEVQTKTSQQKSSKFINTTLDKNASSWIQTTPSRSQFSQSHVHQSNEEDAAPAMTWYKHSLSDDGDYIVNEANLLCQIPS